MNLKKRGNRDFEPRNTKYANGKKKFERKKRKESGFPFSVIFFIFAISSSRLLFRVVRGDKPRPS
jgi:hypothetical protein